MLIGKAINTERTPLVLSQLAIQQLTAINSDGNTLQMTAVNQVNTMKEEYGEGASTLVMIFNASGESLTYQNNYDWAGGIDKYPYDRVIPNGTYSVFLHVKHALWGGSEGCVVYSNQTGLDFLMAWSNPYRGRNNAYADIQANHYWPLLQNWENVYNLQKGQGEVYASFFDNEQYSIFASIGNYTSPIVCYTITRKE